MERGQGVNDGTVDEEIDGELEEEELVDAWPPRTVHDGDDEREDDRAAAAAAAAAAARSREPPEGMKDLYLSLS